jgi:hypothetical protein
MFNPGSTWFRGVFYQVSDHQAICGLSQPELVARIAWWTSAPLLKNWDIVAYKQQKYLVAAITLSN